MCCISSVAGSALPIGVGALDYHKHEHLGAEKKLLPQKKRWSMIKAAVTMRGALSPTKKGKAAEEPSPPEPLRRPVSKLPSGKALIKKSFSGFPEVSRLPGLAGEP